MQRTYVFFRTFESVQAWRCQIRVKKRDLFSVLKYQMGAQIILIQNHYSDNKIFEPLLWSLPIIFSRILFHLVAYYMHFQVQMATHWSRLNAQTGPRAAEVPTLVGLY